MRCLTLHLKRKWFDLIKSGEKKEEYRKQSTYWIKRLTTCDENFLDDLWDSVCVYPNSTEIFNRELQNLFLIKHFDSVRFVLGYPNKCDAERIIEFKNTKIRIGTGRPEWGAVPGVNYFVITWEK